MIESAKFEVGDLVAVRVPELGYAAPGRLVSGYVVCAPHDAVGVTVNLGALGERIVPPACVELVASSTALAVA